MANVRASTPDAHLPASAAEGSGRAAIGVFSISDAVGAEVRGVDLREELDAATIEVIHRAWLDHGVILFRDQHLSAGDLVRFSRCFGELDLGPTMAWQAADQEFPEIFIISNVMENGHPIGFLGNQEADWHTDMSHTAIPPKASTLYALEVPADGSGHTGFMNMYKVYEVLPSPLRSRLEGLHMKHDPAHTLQGELRDGFTAESFEDLEAAEGPVHPLVRTHPESGRKALYLGRERNGVYRAARILGMARAESDRLLDELWCVVRQEQYAWYHTWRVGDYVMWDNRCVMHRRESFSADLRRVMHRTQIRDNVAPA
ncbi:MAG: TauD/TfdA family dioxygenase [Betaproteobacteria bacterium]|nr:TauD/TfdA family dioxygenase [Betaproteobacteria bacterium]